MVSVWIPDADAIEMDEKSLKIVYKNPRVELALSNKKLGISGIKGQGKTFLLKVKRSLVENSAECFPYNILVDQLDNALTLKKPILKFMESFHNWVSLWKIAIATVIIKNQIIRGNFSKNILYDAPTSIKSLFDIQNSNYRPSIYIYSLLSMSRSELREAIEYTTNLLSLLFELHNQIFIFIDKVDQAFLVDIHRIHGDTPMALGPRNASFWQYAQYGLANAAYDIYSNINNHIKVFYTIRQEALIDTFKIAPNLKKNIESYIVNLEYNKHDLKEMFDIYVRCEDDNFLNSSTLKKSNPMKAFIGTDKIENRYIHEGEDAFDYIYRHSLKRPSDIMKICGDLSLDNKILDITRIRTCINNAAGDILNTYVNELLPFLPYSLDKLYNLINTNILSKEYIKFVCNSYSYLQSEMHCPKNCTDCLIVHPFAVLYNIGLLGYAKHDIANNRWVQSFNRVGDSVFLESIAQLPEANYYFIHPCLMDVIRKYHDNYGLRHNTNRDIIVGDGYEFNADEKTTNEIVSEINTAIKTLKERNIFISSIISQMPCEREAIRSILNQRGYNPIMSERDDFRIDARILNEMHSHDYCIDEALKCGSIISIIGKQIGGKYAGTKYEEYKNEIIEKSHNKIKTPSISLMEIYVAIKKGLHYYVFIQSDFDTEKSNSDKWNSDVVVEYNFLNHLLKGNNIKGNWISRYESISDLSTRIKNIVLI